MREELFLEIIDIATNMGYKARWWSKNFPMPASPQDKPILRLYVTNNIQVDGKSLDISTYYIFDNNEFLLMPSVRIGTKEILDKDVFDAIRKSVITWLQPLTDAIKNHTDQGEKNSIKKEDVHKIDIQTHINPKRFAPPTQDDIPF